MVIGIDEEEQVMANAMEGKCGGVDACIEGDGIGATKAVVAVR
jgi:hypothetical protein